MRTSRLMKSPHWQRFALFPALLFVAATAWAAAEPPKIVEVQITPGQITWQPQVETERWLFTVSGQGIFLRETHERGSTPWLSSIAPDGKHLPDGAFNWELRAIGGGKQDDSGTDRRAPEEEAEEVRRMSTERGTFERRTVRRPVVMSGAFRIQDGSFVVEDRQEQEGN